jgi:hypothetical protein
MSRPRRPNKHVEAVVRHAESLGWSVQISNGHAWGRLFCSHGARQGCIISVWSTPRSPKNHARQIRREVDRCPHAPEEPAPQQGDTDGTQETT